jgi:hypothetical protein
MGESSSNPSDYDAYFAGRINESALGQQLKGKIERVTEVLPLVWDAEATYSPGQTVIHDGRIWSWQALPQATKRRRAATGRTSATPSPRRAPSSAVSTSWKWT